MFNKFKYLIIFLTLIGIMMPNTASAVLGTGIFDLFDHMLHGVSEKTSFMVSSIMIVLILYLLGLVLLHASIGILQAFIIQQPLWIENLRPMTMAGWDFMVGLSNMFLVLVFIVIAFAFILKIENLQAKKALPKLIIIAFLINFSLLFVNMAIDITQIIFNTLITAAGPDFWETIIDTITGPLWASVLGLVVLITALILIFSFPIASALGQIIFASLYVTVILPFLLLLGVQIVLFYPLALMFATLAFIFAARVFILQILAVLAPLALVSYILPQTRKFWVFWKNTLFEWLTVGVVFLFLLILGFSVLGLLPPPAPSAPSMVNLPGPLAVIGTMLSPIFSFVSYYFAIVVYVAVILYVGKKFIPQGAQAVMGTIEGIGKMAVSGGVGLASKGILRGRKALQEKGAEKGAERQKAKMEREGTRAGLASGVASRLRAAEKDTALSPFDERRKLSEEEQNVIGWRKRWVSPGEVGKAAAKAEKKSDKATKKHDKAAKKEEVLKGIAESTRREGIDKEAKALAGKNEADLRNIIYFESSKVRLAQNFNRIAAAMEELAKRGKIKGPIAEDEEILKKAIKGGANAGLITDRRPDLGPKIGREIEQVMKEKDPLDLRNKIQKEAMENPEVARVIVENKGIAEEIGKGRTVIKQELWQTINKSENANIFNNPTTKKAIEDNIISDPRYGIPKPSGATAVSQIELPPGVSAQKPKQSPSQTREDLREQYKRPI